MASQPVHGIALIFNYFASMKYVFRHRPDMARWMEMAIFVFSAVVGLLINGLIIELRLDEADHGGDQRDEQDRYDHEFEVLLHRLKDPRAAIASWIAMGVAPTLGFIFLII